MSVTRFRDNNLVLAGALAVVAALLTMLYVARSGGGGTANAASGPTAVVYVAKRDIPIGTAAASLVSRRWVSAQRVPAEAVSPGAIVERSQLSGLVVAQPVYAGEQLTERRFGESGATGLLSTLHGKGRVLRVSGGADQLLAGMLKAGDHVDVLMALKSPEGTGAVGRTVLRNLLVITPADASAAAASPGQNTAWVALQMSDRQARTFFLVVRNSDWSLLLRPVIRPADSADATISTGGLASGAN